MNWDQDEFLQTIVDKSGIGVFSFVHGKRKRGSSADSRANNAESIHESVAKVIDNLRQSNEERRKELESSRQDLLHLAETLGLNEVPRDVSSGDVSRAVEKKIRELQEAVESKEKENNQLRESVEYLERSITASCSESTNEPSAPASPSSPGVSVSVIEQIQERVSGHLLVVNLLVKFLMKVPVIRVPLPAILRNFIKIFVKNGLSLRHLR